MVKSRPNLLYKTKNALNAREHKILSVFAGYTEDAIRRFPENRIDEGHRQDYAVDSDRILHSLAYTRYIDKTQVFYLVDNDHITHRVLHVQLVSKIARTIGRFLGLNEDLIEAIALGHDIGHCPFGHDGEAYLSELCQQAGIGPYLHNVQSIQFLEKIEKKGKGLNLTLQVQDGILCHDGEIHMTALRPQSNKTFATLDREIMEKISEPAFPLTPMTMEGCVVRMADTIAYIGRDVEDAIRLKLIRRTDLPKASVAVLGDTNGTIVYTLVTDLIENSVAKPTVAFSENVSEALKELRHFNLQQIYLNPAIKPAHGAIKTAFQYLFKQYLKDLSQKNELSIIFCQYLKEMSDHYRQSNSPAEIVRDFIAGMTDQYFLRQLPEGLRPARILDGS
jgi:dGTPase